MGDFDCASNRLAESEKFLYDCEVEQICEYYKNKNLKSGLDNQFSDVLIGKIKKVKV